VEKRRGLVETHNEVIQIRSPLDETFLAKSIHHANATEIHEHHERGIWSNLRGKFCFQNFGGILATCATLLKVLRSKRIPIPIDDCDY